MSSRFRYPSRATHPVPSPRQQTGRIFYELHGSDRVGSVKTLEVILSDDIVAKVEQLAQNRGIPVRELLAASVAEKLEREAAFQAAAEYVLTKNAELYERLS
jgi:predicted transcriptional regulator